MKFWQRCLVLASTIVGIPVAFYIDDVVGLRILVGTCCFWTLAWSMTALFFMHDGLLLQRMLFNKNSPEK